MRYWVETLGCPKNQVDSDKLAGSLRSDGYGAAPTAAEADVVVVNTCAFIESARQESIDTILALSDQRRSGARLVVTGCLAERYGEELAALLPEVDQVSGFNVPVSPVAFGAVTGGTVTGGTVTERKVTGSTVTPAGQSVSLGATRSSSTAVPPSPAGDPPPRPVPSFDLLNLARPSSEAPWAYLKIAEGCDRHCGFCAIPSFRGKQRSRPVADLLAEVNDLGAREIVLVAQDLASYGRDLGDPGAIVALVTAVAERADRVRLLYLYPSQLTAGLIDVMGASGCAYFDLSLQHVSRSHLLRMRRWGDGRRFLERIRRIRAAWPEAAFRSSFIVGYPGETEDDHDQLLAFLREARLDWAGFFPYSREDGTYAAGLSDQVPAGLMAERLDECSELQDAITTAVRRDLVGTTTTVLVDAPGQARSHREAPEIDGIIRVPAGLPVGEWATVSITAAAGPDLDAVPVDAVPAGALPAGAVPADAVPGSIAPAAGGVR
jgi:ribosomal protein S12 methylthiotransferase